MASIRRTLSPVPRPGSPMNGEACTVASSPLSKSSLSNQNHAPPSAMLPSSIGSLDYALYKAQNFVLGLLSHRSSRPLERSKLRGQIWRRSLLHYFLCFVVGVFIGFTPFLSPNLSVNHVSKNQAFSFENLQIDDDRISNLTSRVENSVAVDNSTVESHAENSEVIGGIESIDSDVHFNQSIDQDLAMDFHKLLIVVTPIEPRPFQAYYLNRLAHTLKLVPPPLLWIVVEMTSQSAETADTLRRTGVMYRHLVCNKNLTEVKDRSVHMRNVALSHIETHHLDGIVYFADDDKTYSLDLFEQMREIRRFGTWAMPRMAENNRYVILEGPICKGSQVLGWHTNDRKKRLRRFQAEMSGFAFNSTILWDPKRWHRPTLEPIRQIDTVKDGFQATAFIEQIVEDESQMEGIPMNCSRIMVWQFDTEFLQPYAFIRNHSSIITSLI
nr:probable beta-1,4-xylosyltransferase IRX9H [Ipomoea batatas]